MKADLLKKKLDKYMKLAKKSFGLGSKNWVSNREYPRSETKQVMGTIIGRVKKQELQRYITELKEQGVKPTSVEYVKEVSTTNGLTLQENTTIYGIIK